jgi:hypothetical protein
MSRSLSREKYNNITNTTNNANTINTQKNSIRNNTTKQMMKSVKNHHKSNKSASPKRYLWEIKNVKIDYK